jgi:hypothetical protein
MGLAQRLVGRDSGGLVSGGRNVVAVLLGLASVGESACTRPETCVARGSSTSLSGVVSYAIGTGPGTTISQTITVYDYSEGCTYDGEEFPISVGSCTLWVSLEQGPEGPSRYFPGNPSGWAAIEGGQACDLALSGGTATVTVDSGTVAFANATTGVFFSGNVTKWTAGDGPVGAVEWQFQGSGWPR